MIKKGIFLFVIVLSSLMITAQNKSGITPPKVVIDKMNNYFPQSRNEPVNWEMEGKYFKGTVVSKDPPGYAVIDTAGKVMEVARKIDITYLPANAKEYLKKQYPDHTVLDLFVVTDDKQKTTYKATVQIKPVFVFDNNGQLIKKP